MLMNNELYHHGIDGQRWGVQHGPPYPLSRSEHRAVVRSQKATEKRNLSYKRSRKFAKRMNDDDLNATIDRLQREETYRNLVSKEKNAKAVKKALRPLPLFWLISQNAALQCCMAQSLTVGLRNNINHMRFSLFLGQHRTQGLCRTKFL